MSGTKTPDPKSALSATEIAAQCWCDPRTSTRVMDDVLCRVFAEALTAYADAKVKEARGEWDRWWAGQCRVTRNEAFEEAEAVARDWWNDRRGIPEELFYELRRLKYTGGSK